MHSLSACKGGVAMQPCSRRSSVRVAAFKVTFDTPTAQRVLEVDAKTNFLDAAEAAGLELPNLCRNGACGTCASKVTSGQVEQSPHAMSPEQASAGYVLLCSSYPRSDLTLKTHQEEEMYLATTQTAYGSH